MQLSILHIRLWVRMMRLHVHEEYCVASDACVRSNRLRTPLERLRPTLADWLHSRNALYRRPILPAAGVKTLSGSWFVVLGTRNVTDNPADD